MIPDVLIPDGTTFRDALNDEKYVLKLESGVEVLQRMALEDCGAMEYDTSLVLPTNALYEAFDMPAKPDMSDLMVRGDDKLM
jgi:hypothetical protein